MCFTRPRLPLPDPSSRLVARSAVFSLLLICAPTLGLGQSVAPATAAPAATEADAGWILGERTVPTPAAASEALRSAIAAADAPNVEQRRAMTSLSAEQWKAFSIQQAAATDLDVVKAQFGVHIEKSSVEGVPVYRVTPDEPTPAHEGHLFLHLHGGGYVLGGGDAAVTEAAVIAGALGIRAISVDYRMPPDHPFPAAVDDAVAVYRSVIENHPADKIVVGGTSAGGGLTLATTHRLEQLGIVAPGALWLGTPWADLTKTSDSLFTNEGIDRVLITYDGLLGAMARLYAGDEDLEHPLISPIYGDFVDFPPTQLVTGTRDMFLSDTARVHRAIRGAGGVADLNVYEGMSHAEYIMVLDSTESKQVMADLSAFLVEHLQ